MKNLNSFFCSLPLRPSLYVRSRWYGDIALGEKSQNSIICGCILYTYNVVCEWCVHVWIVYASTPHWIQFQLEWWQKMAFSKLSWLNSIAYGQWVDVKKTTITIEEKSVRWRMNACERERESRTRYPWTKPLRRLCLWPHEGKVFVHIYVSIVHCRHWCDSNGQMQSNSVAMVYAAAWHLWKPKKGSLFELKYNY